MAAAGLLNNSKRRRGLHFFSMRESAPDGERALKIVPTGMTPTSLCVATAASPMDATHPHESQSGLPPQLAEARRRWDAILLPQIASDNV